MARADATDSTDTAGRSAEPAAWSAPSREGFALAATLAGDREAALAAPGLAAAVVTELCQLPRALAGLTRASRHARVAELTQRAAQRLGMVAASRTPARPALGPMQLRPGFELERGLAALLSRGASRS